MAVLDPYDPHLSSRLALEMFGSVIETAIRLPFSKTVDIQYKGSAWFMLARDVCEYMRSSTVTH
jgi:hypothetical protein